MKFATPLFMRQEVEMLDWSFDTSWGTHKPSTWLAGILKDFSGRNLLTGHGVSYSLLSADEDAHHQRWLTNLRMELQHLQYQHISEHFGFMQAGRFSQNTPLPVPLLPAFFEIAAENLKRIVEVAERPVGLENLAFAFCEEDLYRQGEFLEKLLAPHKGFIVFDLHNIYCQSVNFGISLERILEYYPLNIVKQLHLSGGSWYNASIGDKLYNLRRDSHDSSVPEEVLAILPTVIKRCPNLESVIYEWLGTDLDKRLNEEIDYERDFLAIKSIVRSVR